MADEVALAAAKEAVKTRLDEFEEEDNVRNLRRAIYRLNKIMICITNPETYDGQGDTDPEELIDQKVNTLETIDNFLRDTLPNLSNHINLENNIFRLQNAVDSLNALYNLTNPAEFW